MVQIVLCCTFCTNNSNKHHQKTRIMIYNPFVSKNCTSLSNALWCFFFNSTMLFRFLVNASESVAEWYMRAAINFFSDGWIRRSRFENRWCVHRFISVFAWSSTSAIRANSPKSTRGWCYFRLCRLFIKLFSCLFIYLWLNLLFCFIFIFLTAAIFLRWHCNCKVLVLSSEQLTLKHMPWIGLFLYFVAPKIRQLHLLGCATNSTRAVYDWSILHAHMPCIATSPLSIGGQVSVLINSSVDWWVESVLRLDRSRIRNRTKNKWWRWC